MNDQNDFKDILTPRKGLFGFLSFVTRTVNLKKSMEINKHCTPEDVKDIAAKSSFLDSVIKVESAKSGISRENLKQQIVKYLDEMALGQNLYSIRLLIYLLLKMSSLLKFGVYLNEPQILKLRESMGKNPLLFLPTHRSYVDCILIGYLSYQYEIELPATAAGIDLSSMAIIGKLFRDSATFYIRRTLAGATLYEATLRQYVQTLVTSYNAPLEVFIEGTRSRGNKSMAPKYGMLSMTLTPMFSGEVYDVVVVPVHMAYDRLVEQLPFVYEHLGVPKPKESTTSLIKAILTANDHFGNIYIIIGTPFSANDYIKKLKSEDPTWKTITSEPLNNHQLTVDQFKLIQKLGDHVIALQQKYTVISVSNLLAVALMGSLMNNKPLSLDKVIEELRWLKDVVKSLGGFVLLEDVVKEVERILVVHSKMIIYDNDGKLKLVGGSVVKVSEDLKVKMKGHTLKDETIVRALPIMQLQLYVNPVLHYLVPSALVHALLIRGAATEERLSTDWHRIRKLLKYEFFYDEKDENETFKKALQYCKQNNVVFESERFYSVGNDERLQFLLKWTIWPTLTTLLKCADVMTELWTCEHKKALKTVQEQVELSECYPYCLSLDVAANCLQGLTLAGALIRHKGDETVYELVPEVMAECRQMVNAIMPTFSIEFGRNNAVIFNQEVEF